MKTFAWNVTTKNICNVKNYQKKFLFGGITGPGNSINLHNFLYWLETLRVYASFHDAYSFLMRCFQRPTGYFYISAFCKVVRHLAFAFFSHFLIEHSSGVLFDLVFKFQQLDFFSEFKSPRVVNKHNSNDVYTLL